MLPRTDNRHAPRHNLVIGLHMTFVLPVIDLFLYFFTTHPSKRSTLTLFLGMGSRRTRRRAAREPEREVNLIRCNRVLNLRVLPSI